MKGIWLHVWIILVVIVSNLSLFSFCLANFNLQLMRKNAAFFCLNIFILQFMRKRKLITIASVASDEAKHSNRSCYANLQLSPIVLGAIHTKIDLRRIDLRSISVRFVKVFTLI